MDPTPEMIATELVRQLFDAPGDFTITMEKRGGRLEIFGGGRRDFMTLGQVAKEFGVSEQTIRNRFLLTKRLRRTINGYRRSDVERLKRED